MKDRLDTALQIPCLVCGSMPECAWEGPDWLHCSDEECPQRLFGIHFESWPSILTKAEKKAAWKASDL